MAYTYDQLVQAYTAAHDGIGPDAATQATFQIQAVQSANGQLTDAQLLSNIVNSADSTTTLAVLAYQFFTGKSPTQAGIDYLVNSSVNNSDLNDAYYSKFSLENRYINFAANLGVQGEGAANFSAKYGALSFSDYVASIYQTIIGASYATAAGVDASKAIADIISRKDAILATAASAGMIPANATAAQIDIALKAATAGYLLGEAIKADVGLYAAAANNFMVAVVQGTAVYNTDITYTYQPAVGTPSHGTGHALDNAPPVLPTPAPPTTTQPADPTGPTAPVAHAFVLTASADTFTGESLVDTFTGTDTTFNAGDILNGAGGNDTLTITGSIFGTYTAPSFSHVSNIETVNISNTFGVSADVAAATGLQTLNVTSNGALGGNAMVWSAGATNTNLTVTNQTVSTITVNGGKDVTVTTTGNTGGLTYIGNTGAPTGAITVSATTTGATTGGTITVSGGTTVNVTQAATNANSTTQTNGWVDIYGRATTTSVTVHSPAPATPTLGVPGVNANVVTVTDVFGGGGSTTVGKIATIDVDSYSRLDIVDNGLTSLILAHGSGNVSIGNGNSLAPGNQTTALNLSLNAVTNGNLNDTGVYTALNVTTGANPSTLGNISFGALTTLNLSGATNLTLTSTAGAGALQAVTVTGAASLVASFSGSTLASINTSGSTGATSVSTQGMTTAITFTGGAGNDTITVNGLANAISVGTGSDRVNIGASPATGSVFTSITGMTHGTGDKVSITSAGSTAATAWNATATAFNTDFATTLNDAATGDGHTTSLLHWFVIGGDSYIVQDNSTSATFVNGVDVVVKIIGVTDLSTAAVVAGVITI